MNIIRHDPAPAHPFTLEERIGDNTRTLGTFTDRAAALAQLDEEIRQHPVRYRSWTNFRLVVVGPDHAPTTKATRGRQKPATGRTDQRGPAATATSRRPGQ